MLSPQPPQFAVFSGNKIKSNICPTRQEAIQDALDRPDCCVQASWQHFVLKPGLEVREVSSIDMDAIYKKKGVKNG